ncbi:unnamed protein product, partial [Polarella glacialis]
WSSRRRYTKHATKDLEGVKTEEDSGLEIARRSVSWESDLPEEDLVTLTKSQTGFGRLAGWFSKLARQKSYAPWAADGRSRTQNLLKASSTFNLNGGPTFGMPNQHHYYLAAFLSGDLAVLDSCIQGLYERHGLRAFLALSDSVSRTISATEWLECCGHGMILPRITALRDLSMDRRTDVPEGLGYHGPVDAPALIRAFALLRQLTSGPRLELGDRRPEDSRQPDPASPYSSRPATPLEFRSSVSRSDLEEGRALIFADFEQAQAQIFRAQTVAQRLVRGMAGRMSARQEAAGGAPRPLDSALELALDDVEPAVRLSRAAARASKQGVFSDACDQVRFLWSLCGLEPASTIRACWLQSEPNIAQNLGYLVRRAARGVVAGRNGPTCSDTVESLVLTLGVCAELSRIHVCLKRKEAQEAASAVEAAEFGRQRHNKNQLASNILLGRRAGNLLTTMTGKFCTAPFAEEEIAGKVLKAMQPRSAALCMAAVASLKQSDSAAAAAILGAVWQLLDQSCLPESKSVRPHLEKLACAVGLAPACRPGPAGEGVAFEDFGGEVPRPLLRPAKTPQPPTLQAAIDEKAEAAAVPAKKHKAKSKRSSSPKVDSATARKALEEMTRLLSDTSRGKEAIAARVRCVSLYGAAFLAHRLARDCSGGDSSKSKGEAERFNAAARKLFKLIQPNVADLMAKGLQGPADENSRSRARKQIAGNAVLEAGVREMRRSIFTESEFAWLQLGRSMSFEEEEADEVEDDPCQGIADKQLWAAASVAAEGDSLASPCCPAAVQGDAPRIQDDAPQKDEREAEKSQDAREAFDAEGHCPGSVPSGPAGDVPPASHPSRASMIE